VILSCQAALFDLDGVLVNSTIAVERVWRKWAHAHNIDPDSIMEKAHGRRSLETLRLVAPHLDAEKENLIVERMEIEDKEGIVSIAGANELLESLPPERFMIVTSATAALAAARLQYAGFRVPERMVTSEDVDRGKPFPEPYQKGAAALGFAPADCVVFEDTPAGIQAGKAAGMRVVALTSTYDAEELTAADAIIDSLAAVKARLQKGILCLELGVGSTAALSR
jgi:mannitol-1-/sugar-/sorbitol-6-phosphatase